MEQRTSILENFEPIEEKDQRSPFASAKEIF
jgi:hypothetical protein